jgi:dynein heavy chain
MLRTWRKAAKAQAFARVRKSLEGRLLLAKPEFCYSILDLQAKVGFVE